MAQPSGRAATLRLAAPRLARTRRLSRVRRLGRDPYFVYSAGLAPVALVVAMISSVPGDAAAVLLLTPVFLALQAVAGLVPTRLRPMTAMGWSFLRLSLTLMFVWALVESTGGPTRPLLSLYLPVVAAAAAVGTTQAIVLGTVAAAIFLAPELAQPGGATEVALRGVGLAGVSTLLAVGTRRLVTQIERTSHQFRAAALAERRRSRQITGLEEVSRLLVTGGATPELLDRVAGVLADRFGYALAAIFVAEEGMLRMGAQRGYAVGVSDVDPSRGVVGRAARSGEVQLVQDVSADPDYVAGDQAVVSEIAAPMILEGVLLGVVNVESTKPESLDRVDRDLVATIAGRVATALAMARDRQSLAELAIRDGLTGLHNRRYFDEALARLLTARRALPDSERRPVSAIMFDLDNFGQFNKLHGAQVGDQVLRVFAHVLRDRLRQTDMVARYGGEEFVAILDGADRDQAVRVANAIRALLDQRTVPAEDGAPLRVSVSAGCAALDDEDPVAEALIRTADVALSMAKRAGRNRVVAA